MKILVYVVLLMVLYDFSVHVIFMFHKEDFFLSRHLNYWPEWKDKTVSKVRYQQFWTIYWGVAAILLLIYLINK